MTWNVLQSALAEGDGSTDSSTVSATFGSNLTSGTVLLALVSQFGEPAPSGVNDGNGHSFTQVATGENLGEGSSASLWVLATPSGDAGTKPTITATGLNGGNGGFYAMLIQEVAGISATPDGTAAELDNNGVGSSPLGPPAYASSAAGEYLVYAFTKDGYGVTVSAPAGYTADPNSALSTGTCRISIAYKNSTGGTESGAWSWTGGSDAVILFMVAFPLSGGAPPVGQAPLPQAVRSRYYPPLRRGRVYGISRGAPVRNPTSGPPLSMGGPAGIRAVLLRTGVAASTRLRQSQVTPPPVGPVFRQVTSPIRAKLPYPPRGPGVVRGRVYSNPGAPVQNPSSGPPYDTKFTQWVTVIPYRTGW